MTDLTSFSSTLPIFAASSPNTDVQINVFIIIQLICGTNRSICLSIDPTKCSYLLSRTFLHDSSVEVSKSQFNPRKFLTAELLMLPT